MLVFCSTSTSTGKTSDPDLKTGTLCAEVPPPEEAGLRVPSPREPEPRTAGAGGESTSERAREGGSGSLPPGPVRAVRSRRLQLGVVPKPHQQPQRSERRALCTSPLAAVPASGHEAPLTAASHPCP